MTDSTSTGFALAPELEARLREQLAFLYGAERAATTFERLREMLAAFQRQHRNNAPAEPRERLTQDDVVLITYGDQWREAGRPPLHDLVSGTDMPPASDGGVALEVAPYQVPWLTT